MRAGTAMAHAGMWAMLGLGSLGDMKADTCTGGDRQLEILTTLGVEAAESLAAA